MNSWKQYILSIIVCLITCGIVSQIISDTKRKELVNLICGLILSISLLTPLTRLDLEDLWNIPAENWNGAEFYVSEGKKTASAEQAQYIKASCEAYILNKAKLLGADVTVQISLDEKLVPVFAEINGGADPGVQWELQNILMTDLGIPKENQKWIWNPENNSS